MNLKNGYAFIIYEDPRDAEAAIRGMDGVEFDGSRLIVEASHGGGPPRPDRGYGGYGPPDGRERDRERDRGYGPIHGHGGPPPDRDRGYGPPHSNHGAPLPRSRGPPSYSTEYRVIIEGLPPNCDWRDLKDLMRVISPPTYADVGRNGTGIVHFDRPEDVRRVIKELHDTKFQGSRIFLKEEIVPGGANHPPPRERERERPERYHPYRADPREMRGGGEPHFRGGPRDDFRRRSISPRARGPPSPVMRGRSPPRRAISPRRPQSPLPPRGRSPSPPPRRVARSPSPRRNTP